MCVVPHTILVPGKYGKDMEYFEKNMGIAIQKCGLIIDEDYPFLGASPGKYDLTASFFSN